MINATQDFFRQYLFVTKSNYAKYLEQASIEAKRKSAEFDTAIARLKTLIASKEKLYGEAKDLILKNPDLKQHYDLNKHAEATEKLKADYTRATKQKDGIKAAIPSFEEYLKLLESTPDALGKIRDMKVMDALIRIFFSNFTIKPVKDGNFKGSAVTYKLNEPWKGFVENKDFVRGAPSGL